MCSISKVICSRAFPIKNGKTLWQGKALRGFVQWFYNRVG